MTIGNIRSVKVAAICVALLVSACAESDLFSPYAAPGKYDFLDCPSIATRITSTTTREQQLIELMSRAKESTTGPIRQRHRHIKINLTLLAQTYVN